ncbi:substrate-binding periplasmic protein [Planctobacterium marinum]|uniref:substrate-binding periplasmic protein n=1 Tax=Planctobacterium marinum TaxID=1631968 RepID=UPI001E46F4F4|nr:transporter substrate-binding domain-containing protein [Planctobacterium marinum]MCC2604950.1 transporter substrate-binding domain-containing protein [Planctobacterium marinum]
MKVYQCCRWLIVMLALSAGNVLANPLLFVAEELPPIHFNDENNTATGFLVAIAAEVASRAEYPAKTILMPQARAFELTSNEANVFMLSLLKSGPREAQFQWVGAVYETQAFLIGLKSNQHIQLTSLQDAKKYVVGTVRGYFSESYLRQQGFSDKHNLGLASRYDHLWGMLFKAHIDFVLTNTLSQNIEINKAGYSPDQVMRFLALPELARELHIATGLTTDKVIVERLKKALESMKRDGSYDSIKAQWQL